MRPRNLARARQRGRSSLLALRLDAADTPRNEAGSWFQAGLRRRLALRVTSRLAIAALAILALGGRRFATLAAEAAFWSGVRNAARPEEWRRLTRSSYVVIYYHRLAGEGKPGQERLDLPPSLFAAQLRLLRLLRFRALSARQLHDFHSGDLVELPRRSYVITADDGFLDCVEPFLSHAWARPQLYVPTAEVGGRSWWAGDEPLVDWDDLARLAAAGVHVGSHAHRHRVLPELDDEALADALTTSCSDLAVRVSTEQPLLAYPHGRRDGRVMAAARAAGFRLALTTDPGRNGAGTDPLQLRRVGAKAWDSRLSFLWKVATGELLPRRWEQLRIRRSRRESPRRRSTSPGGGA